MAPYLLGPCLGNSKVSIGYNISSTECSGITLKMNQASTPLSAAGEGLHAFSIQLHTFFVCLY